MCTLLNINWCNKTEEDNQGITKQRVQYMDHVAVLLVTYLHQRCPTNTSCCLHRDLWGGELSDCLQISFPNWRLTSSALDSLRICNENGCKHDLNRLHIESCKQVENFRIIFGMHSYVTRHSISNPQHFGCISSTKNITCATSSMQNAVNSVNLTSAKSFSINSSTSFDVLKYLIGKSHWIASRPEFSEVEVQTASLESLSDLGILRRFRFFGFPLWGATVAAIELSILVESAPPPSDVGSFRRLRFLGFGASAPFICVFWLSTHDI